MERPNQDGQESSTAGNRKKLNFAARTMALASLFVAGGIGTVEKTTSFDPLANSVGTAKHLILDNPPEAYEQIIDKLPSAENAEAAVYTRDLVVDTVTVYISGLVGATNTDVDNVHNKLSTAVNGSNTFKDVVKAAGSKPGHNNELVVGVYRNNTNVSVGDVPNNQPGNTCCTNIIHIDVGDTEYFGNFLGGGAIDDRNLVRNNFLTEVLIHEVYHTNNIVDPQTNENPILADLGIFYRRLNYYLVTVGTDKYINFEAYSNPPSRTVTFNATQYDRGRNCGVNPGFWEEPAESCSVDGSVGGSAELPESSELPQNMDSEKSRDNETLIAAGGIAAAVAAALTAVGIAAYKRNSRIPE